MADKKKSIDKIDEQIKKLKQDDVEVLDEDVTNDTKDFKEVDETKVFENDELSDKTDGDVKKEKTLDTKSRHPDIVLVVGIVALIIFTILSAIFIIYYAKSDKEEIIDSEDDNNKLTDLEKESIINKYGVALEKVISNYYDKYGVVLGYGDAIKLVQLDDDVECLIHEIYEDGKVYLDKCSIDGEETNYGYGEKLVVIKPAGHTFDVYVDKVTGVATLTKSASNYYDLYTVHCGTEYSDVFLLDEKGDYVFYYDSDGKLRMMNFKTDQVALANLEYQEILPIENSNGTYDSKNVAVKINDFWAIYDVVNSKQIISPMYSAFVSAQVGIGPNNSIKSVADNLIIASDGKNVGVINYLTNKAIIGLDYKYIIPSSNYIWAKDHKNNSYVFDTSGKRYFTQYDRIYGIVDGKYILVEEDASVKIIKSDGSLLYNYGSIPNMGELNFGMSYDGNTLFQVYNTESGDKCIEIVYNEKEKVGSTKNIVCGGVAKPVLYLYPKEKTNVVVSFEKDDLLETTYPKYYGGWTVEADSNGNLRDKDGKFYYALYWDEKKVHSVDFSEGFYVEGDQAISFLEEKLSYIGLNDRERNEFIMYWLPVLEKNKKSLVYFELTEEREKYNKININPKPDSLLRVVIHIKKVDKKISIKKENLLKTSRKGFVAVEWGGTVY